MFLFCKYFYFCPHERSPDHKDTKVDLKLDVKSIDHKTDEKSREDKIKEQNRIRQMAFRIRQKMPKDYETYCSVAEHLMKNAHRYQKPVEEIKVDEIVHVKKEETFEVKKEIESPVKVKSDDLSLDPCKDVNKQLRTIKSLKTQNRIREQQHKVCIMKDQFGSYRDISKTAGIALKTVHSWCAAPKERNHLATVMSDLRRQEFTNFLMQDTISFSHPCKKYAGKKFLMHTWEEIHTRYLQQPEYHHF